ncbi:UDP-N-acetylglucosamine 2-epimerase [Thermaerobacter subterraneus DSM 13965]|uniref:UDP-N-acetylglucosamine 2-epimerase (non-hydrolyzing) n=1 Tax=Thermaerobacter subterraneus DSM 13965 TaxID=867903 RepID=K6Q0N3_9FIRM|nr:UDP-N-acetylglucosamine 2-epimerase [Thermaerobacter subterraneus DSM 13965]
MGQAERARPFPGGAAGGTMPRAPRREPGAGGRGEAGTSGGAAPFHPGSPAGRPGSPAGGEAGGSGRPGGATVAAGTAALRALLGARRPAGQPLKVLVVFGTRPEATKMAPVIHQLARRPAIRVQVAVTAQHRELLDQVLHLFGIEPDFDLDIMQPRQTLTDITTRALQGLEAVLRQAQPHLVLVHGDTTTTLAGALAAFYHQVAIGHVEAGLRTYDKYQPFPEEINRRLTDALCDLHFAPTPASRANLLREGIDPAGIFVTGNTAIDALLSVVSPGYRFRRDELARFPSPGRRLVLCEAHRRENWGEPLEAVARALRRLVESHPDIELVYSVHPNPVVSGTIRRHLEGVERVSLLDPPEYADWANLMARATLLLTDSGGLQEEAPALGLPVLLLRDKTERPEAVEAGTVLQVGPHEEPILRTARRLLTDPAAYRQVARARNPFGDGQAARRTVEAIEYVFGLRDRPPDPWDPGLPPAQAVRSAAPAASPPGHGLNPGDPQAAPSS